MNCLATCGNVSSNRDSYGGAGQSVEWVELNRETTPGSQVREHKGGGVKKRGKEHAGWERVGEDSSRLGVEVSVRGWEGVLGVVEGRRVSAGLKSVKQTTNVC